MTIPNPIEKIKAVQTRLDSRESIAALLIILVGVASFGLGRLSKMEASREPIRVIGSGEALSASALFSVSPVALQKQAAENIPLPADPTSGGGEVVASKNSDKYHFPWCSGAARISEANKITFASVEDARAAGYIPASNCKGLK